MAEQRNAFIAIVGCPNVGKSSILNYIIGEKIAIVSDKPQTTRTRIMGVLTTDDIQLVFTDTPGFHKPGTKLGEKMVKAVDDSISGVDACLFVTEPKGNIRPAEEALIEKFSSMKIPVILAVNKVDTIADKTELLGRIAMLNERYPFKATVPVSALKGDNMDELLDELKALAEPGVHFFPDDTLTDSPERVIAAEMIREKLLRSLDKEVPHGTAVVIETMHEREDSDIVDIDAIIYCEKESHKGIIIGKGGSMLKRVLTSARGDMEKFFQCRINLQCRVKVKEDWRNRESLIHNFGLD